MLTDLVQKMASGSALSEADVKGSVQCLVEDRHTAEEKAAFLAALNRKGETIEEIAAFVVALRHLSVPVPVDPAVRLYGLLDVCGTGGDQSHTFNISTTVALIAAAAGVRVAKHGNRAITSKSGSADVLEALGVAVELTPHQAAVSLSEHGFAFLFAPRFHPAFRHIAPARRRCAEQGQRTIFNILGPLLNPALPDCQMVGVPQPQLCEPIAHVLQNLKLRRGLVVCGHVAVSGSALPRYLDELSTLGESTLAEFYQESGFSASTLSPEAFAIPPATLADLAGGDSRANAAHILAVLRGEDCGPRRDIVLLNAAAALLVAGRVRSLAEGWDLAAEQIDGGAALATLEALQAFARKWARA
jgi:anthranilate phosphoribosyltransferase